MSCSPRKSHVTRTDYNVDNLELFEEMIFNFATDLSEDFRSKEYSSAGDFIYTDTDFLSEGNSAEEFCNGILNFLDLIGYEKQKIEPPLRDFLIESDPISRDAAFSKLLQLSANHNGATARLLNSVLARVMDNENVYQLSFEVSYPVVISTGVIYQVVDSLHSNAYGIFETMAELIEAKESAPSKNSCRIALRYLVAVQLFASYADPSDIDGTHNMIYSIGSEVSRDCLTSYSEDPEVNILKLVIDGIHSIQREFNKCVGGNSGYIQHCTIRYYLSMISLPFEFAFSCSSGLPPIREVLRHPPLDERPCADHIIDRTREGPIREHFNPRKHILERFPNR